MRNSYTEAEEEACSDEHSEVDANGLEDNTEDHDETADEDTKSTAYHIWDVPNDWDCGKRTDCHDAVEQAQQRAGGVIEVLLPVR